ncbi:hypothetical protein SAMN05421823_106115 [Catalinimonas alkaloidigena]|uniref:Uncharacterized protein n=1 Tax=Catalinimonas alkaloidigena TaxID=1075417 RepID=A0A1G9KCS7_9BACT|nr:hypothetical protein SAMN05421823_106115 [Catalinimonas alkaloidigena]
MPCPYPRAGVQQSSHGIASFAGCKVANRSSSKRLFSLYSFRYHSRPLAPDKLLHDCRNVHRLCPDVRNRHALCFSGVTSCVALSTQ